MKGTTLAVLMVVGILAFAALAIGVSYAKYDEATTVVSIENGITCTINDKEVHNGDTITVRTGEYNMKIRVESEYDLPIGIAGKWTSDTRTVTCCDLDTKELVVAFGHGVFDGKLAIGYTADDGDIAAVVLKFTIGDGITVTHGSDEIKDGDTYSFPNDSTIVVKTNDGQRHNVKYNGSWSNDYGMSGGANGEELGSSVNISIIDMMYFGDGHGTMEIHI